MHFFSLFSCSFSYFETILILFIFLPQTIQFLATTKMEDTVDERRKKVIENTKRAVPYMSCISFAFSLPSHFVFKICFFVAQFCFDLEQCSLQCVNVYTFHLQDITAIGRPTLSLINGRILTSRKKVFLDLDTIPKHQSNQRKNIQYLSRLGS